MSRLPPVAPTFVEKTVMGEEFNHPAYGMISASRITGGIGKLVGSDLNHHHAVKLEIFEACRIRGLSRDWWHSRRLPIVSITLSEHQWASFLLSMNTSGVPCTLTFKDNQEIPGVVEESSHEVVQRELKESAKKAVRRFNAATTTIKEMLAGTKKVNKTTLTELMNIINMAEQEAVSNMPYQVEQHKEVMEKNVEAAKSEIEGYVTHTLVRVGLEHLKGPSYGQLSDRTGTGLQSDENQTDRG